MQVQNERFYLEIVQQMDESILFKDGKNFIQLPRKLINIEHIKGADFEVEIPIWLAKRKDML